MQSNIFNKYSILFLIIIICIFFIKVLVGSKYFIVFDDETIYYNSARLFKETNCLKSSFCIEENRSIIGEFNWYGPFFSMFYGIIFKLFGSKLVYTAVINFILFLLSIFTINTIDLSKEKKISFTLLFLTTYISSQYIFSFFPEQLIILFSIILISVYSRINMNKKYLYLFIGLVFFFSLFRYSLVFWGLAVFTNKRVSLKFKILISFILFLLIIIYVKLFTAPAFVVGLKEIHKDNGVYNLMIIIKNTLINGINNIRLVFDKQYITIPILTFFVLCIYVAFKSTNDKMRLFKNDLGLFFVLGAFFSTLLFFYTFTPFFIEKQLANLIVILIFLVLSANDNDNKSFIYSFLFLIPFSLFQLNSNINQRENFYSLSRNDLRKYNFSIIKNYLNGKKEYNLLYVSKDFSNSLGNLLTINLPVSKDEIPILYTSNVIASDFSLHNKIKIDGIITKQNIKVSNFELKYKSKAFNFYLKTN